MNGTMAAATRAIHLMPPMITRPSRIASAPPLSQCGMPKERSRPLAKLSAWGMLPEPRVLTTVATANSTASHLKLMPSQRSASAVKPRRRSAAPSGLAVMARSM